MSDIKARLSYDQSIFEDYGRLAPYPIGAGALLTVILTSYNYGRYLDDCLGGLVPQLGQEVKLLILDDGSTDGSQVKLKRRASESEYITLMEYKENAGIHVRINQGLSLVKTPWILFSAADDLVYPEFLARALPLLRKYPQAGILTAPADYLDESGRYESRWTGPSLPDNVYMTPRQAGELMGKYGFWFAGLTTVLAADKLRAAGGFEAELGHLADSFVAQKLALTHGLIAVAVPMAGVRRLPGSYSHSGQRDPRRELAVRQAALERMKKRPDIFPESFQKHWGAFIMIWGALRAGLKGQNQVAAAWLSAAPAEIFIPFRIFFNRPGGARPWRVRAALAVMVLAALVGNPLFRTRTLSQLRRKFKIGK